MLQLPLNWIREQNSIKIDFIHLFTVLQRTHWQRIERSISTDATLPPPSLPNFIRVDRKTRRWFHQPKTVTDTNPLHKPHEYKRHKCWNDCFFSFFSLSDGSYVSCLLSLRLTKRPWWPNLNENLADMLIGSRHKKQQDRKMKIRRAFITIRNDGRNSSYEKPRLHHVSLHRWVKTRQWNFKTHELPHSFHSSYSVTKNVSIRLTQSRGHKKWLPASHPTIREEEL